MKKIFLLLVIGITILSATIAPNVFSQENIETMDLDAITHKLGELQRALEASQKATEPLESQVANIQTQLTGIENRVAAIERDIAQKKEQIEKGYQELDDNKNVFNATVRNYYIKSHLLSPLLVFLAAADASEITRFIVYQKKDADKDKNSITALALKVVDLETRKQKLESEEAQLASIKVTLASERDELDRIVQDAKNYQNVLSGQIAELSARQQQIINERSGGFTVSGDSELADDYLASISGFNESAPSGYFAVFSFGAYSHRNGMSQYGARGRAQQGQSAEEILKAYYPGTTLKKDFNAMENIDVQGHGHMSFEDQYLQGIYEIPSSWHTEALRAQAIAARTFAIRHTNNGQSSICTTEACQVFKNEKKGGAWEQAVNDTRGWVLVDGGENPVSTQYASTHGGWTKTAGWDTTDGSGGSSLLSKAYDAIGGSPWLYKAWWRQGYSSSGSTCGRSNPWLSPQEMADIVNAAIALKNSDGIDTGRIAPITTSCWSGTNPYSMDELKNLVAGKGGISNATSVSVSLGDGKTNSVTINGVNLNGDEFCKAFNLRAPGYVRIPQWSGSACGGAFFNIERK